MTELKYTFSRVNIMEPIARCINVMQEGSAQGDDKFREEIERGVAEHTLHSRIIAALFFFNDICSYHTGRHEITCQDQVRRSSETKMLHIAL